MKVRFLIVPAILVLLTGCTEDEQSHENAEANPVIRIVQDIREAGPGPLAKEEVSIGGIHIGDSQDTVRNILGEPTTIQEGGGGTPFVHWYYEQHNAYISFYRTSGTDPAGGVADISVNAPSSLKTDKNIGIGDSLSSMIEAYDHLLSSGEKDGIVNIWINGSREDEGFYNPQLHFVLKNDRITHYQLTTNLMDPDKLP